MKGIGTAVAVCTILLASMADAATDIPGNKNTKVKLPTGSAGIDGDLFGVGDSDWYKVQLDKGYNYGVLVDAYCPATVLRLLDRDGRQLGTAKGFFDLPAFISWQTIYSGLYYIEVKATGIYVDCEESYYGGFTLSAFRECGPDARTRCTLEPGKPLDSWISAHNDKDWFRIDLPTTGTYTFRASDPVNNSFMYKPKFSLRRADTSVITDTDRNDPYECAPGPDGGPCLRLPLKAGRYYLAVRSPNEEGSNIAYRVSLNHGS